MNLTEGYFQAIGRVTATFNTLETLLHYVVWSLISEKTKVADIATRGDRFPTSVAKLQALAAEEVEDQELRDWLVGWSKRALAANDLRVDVVHSTWIPTIEGDEPPERPISLRLTRKGGMKVSVITVEELDAIATHMQTLVDDGMKLLAKLAEFLPHMRQ